MRPLVKTFMSSNGFSCFITCGHYFSSVRPEENYAQQLSRKEWTTIRIYYNIYKKYYIYVIYIYTCCIMNNICDICIFFHVQYISYISASLHIWAYLGSPKHWVFTNSTMSQGLQILQLLGSKPRNEAPRHRWRINHARLCPPKKQTMSSKKSCRIIPEKTSSPDIPYFFAWQSTSLCFLWNLSHSARTETG